MDKIEKILDIIDHPEKYSEEEIRLTLADEESRKLYKTLCETAGALAAEGAEPDVEKEWRRFAAARAGAGLRRPVRFARLRKVAAVAAGAALLSGASLAAYHYIYVRPLERRNALSQAKETSIAIAQGDTARIAAKKTEARTFVNVPLEKMLGEIAAYYEVKVEFKDARAKALRLYYDWDSRKGLEKTLKELSQFENVSLTLNGGTIVVE